MIQFLESANKFPITSSMADIHLTFSFLFYLNCKSQWFFYFIERLRGFINLNNAYSDVFDYVLFHYDCSVFHFQQLFIREITLIKSCYASTSLVYLHVSAHMLYVIKMFIYKWFALSWCWYNVLTEILTALLMLIWAIFTVFLIITNPWLWNTLSISLTLKLISLTGRLC